MNGPTATTRVSARAKTAPDAMLKPMAPVATVAKAPPLRSGTHLVHLSSAGADVLLPATGRTAAASYRQWATALQAGDFFGDERREVAELAAATPHGAPADVDDRPVIGIVVHQARHLVNPREDIVTLIDEVKRLGCRPVIIPPLATLASGDDSLSQQAAVASLLGRLDGLIGPGGDDIDPKLYREPRMGSVHTNYPRDVFEAELFRQALDESLFFLGICRSHQLFNVVAGSTMVQDLQAEGVASETHDQRDLNLPFQVPLMLSTPEGELSHSVVVLGDVAAVVERSVLMTNSLHHQAIDGVGDGFSVAGRHIDPKTGRTIIEATTRWNGITVQFHPEFRTSDDSSSKLLETLRRSWAFFVADELRQEGAQLDVETIFERLARRNIMLSRADEAWVRHELSQRLPRSTPWGVTE